MKKLIVSILLSSQLLYGSEKFPDIGPWNELGPLPIGLCGHSAWNQNGTFYSVGGTYWEGGEKRWTSTIWSYSDAENRWEKKAFFPTQLAYMATSTYNNDIYLAGGTTKDQPQNKVYKLTPDFKHHDLPELPVPRVLPGTCIIGSKYYVFGGCKHINQVWTSSNAMFVLDLNNIQQGWQKGTGIPGEGRADFSYTRSGGHIFVFGGMNSNVNGPILNFKDAYKYDPETEKWQRLEDLPVAIRSSATCTYDDRYIFISGGYKPKIQISSDVYAYDTQKDDYHKASSLPYGLAGHKSILLGERLYIISGEDKSGGRTPRFMVGDIVGRIP